MESELFKIHGEMSTKIEWIGSTAIAAAIVSHPGILSLPFVCLYVLLLSDLVTITKAVTCEVERVGVMTRGQSVFDFGPFKQDSKTPPNIAVITEIDMVQFHQVLRRVIV